jgi:hypothetical protein
MESDDRMTVHRVEGEAVSLVHRGLRDDPSIGQMR